MKIIVFSRNFLIFKGFLEWTLLKYLVPKYIARIRSPNCQRYFNITSHFFYSTFDKNYLIWIESTFIIQHLDFSMYFTHISRSILFYEISLFYLFLLIYLRILANFSKYIPWKLGVYDLFIGSKVWHPEQNHHNHISPIFYRMEHT